MKKKAGIVTSRSKLTKHVEKYKCKICDFTSVKKSNLQAHFLTKKHIKNSKNVTKISQNGVNNAVLPPYMCKECECSFNNRTTLWRHKKMCQKNVVIFCCEDCNLTFNTKLNLMHHKKKCDEQLIFNTVDENVNVNENATNKLLMLIPKLTDAILKIAERPASGNTNCNNKMTINMYLNNECKDAMNLTDFVNKVKVSLGDLMYTQEHGYVKGISNIFVKQLQDMDPKERPIHCSDKKRMQFYVKEEDKWEKDKQHTKINNSIAKITHKQILKIREWEDKHPNFLENDKLTHIWQKMCAETMGGAQDAERNKNCINIKKEVSNIIEVKEAMKN
jgi:hypothetical protein